MRNINKDVINEVINMLAETGNPNCILFKKVSDFYDKMSDFTKEDLSKENIEKLISIIDEAETKLNELVER